ncbi:hypothetical protein [Desulfosporosinus acididurans]|uniref:hypothetical protein n=1 Tax=Desulfosporosinus acididurans TaxID=476652 RepID=UPI000649EAC3|nr:hypothetical protein [Desulfosporosinus acididurans]
MQVIIKGKNMAAKNNWLLINSKNINPFTGAIIAKLTITKGLGPKCMTIKVVPNAIAQNIIANIKKLFFLSRPLKIPNENHNTKKSIVKMKFKTVGGGPSTNPLVLNIVAKTIVKWANVIFSINLIPPNT